MPVTKDQADMLATLACAARPTGAPRWDAAGVVAAIGKVKHMHLADVMLAVARAADDRSVETPGVIGNPKSPCWRERAAVREQPRETYDRAGFCGVCGESEATCRRKWTGDHVYRSRAVELGSAIDTDVAATVEALRAEVVEAKAARPVVEPKEVKPDPRAEAAREALHQPEEASA